MNAKTAKLLRKYCTAYCKDYRQYKKHFKLVERHKQQLVLDSLYKACK